MSLVATLQPFVESTAIILFITRASPSYKYKYVRQLFLRSITTSTDRKPLLHTITKNAIFDHLKNAKMPPPLYFTSKNTLPRPSNFNYSQLVDSVHCAMNTCHASTRPIQCTSNSPSISSTFALNNDKLRKINGPIPSICDHICEATEKMENMHLDLLPEWQDQLYRTQPPVTTYMTETRKSRSECPRVHPQGPRPKPMSGSTSVATTVSRHESGDSADRIRLYESYSPSDYPRGSFAMDSMLIPHRLKPGNSPPCAYVRVEKDLQSVNRSLKSWLIDPRHHPHYDQQY